MKSGASAGSSRAFRLDPLTLPVRHATRQSATAAETAFVLDRDCATVRQPLRSGPTVTLSVPVSAYRGVAVRIVPSGAEGEIQTIVELMHRDPTLTLPLVVADEPWTVAADWEAWGEALDLPLLLVEANGSVRTIAEPGKELATAPAKPRRRHSFFAGRRPRFLTRRKTGRKGEHERLAGREIIARD